MMLELNYPNILKTIQSFYDKATFDVMIGYHFRGITDFNSHIPRIAQFWQLQLTGEIENRQQLPFQLIEVHKPLKVKTAELNRWVMLFEQNLNEYHYSIEDKKKWMEKVYLFKEKLKSGLAL